MPELTPHEVGAIVQNFRHIEKICKDWHIPITEIEKALPKSADVVETTELRSALKTMLNQSRLKEVAQETDMPAAIYLSLEQAFAHNASASTSLREDRPLTKEEFTERGVFMQRGKPDAQKSLFDEPQAVAIARSHSVSVYDDEIGYPCG